VFKTVSGREHKSNDLYKYCKAYGIAGSLLHFPQQNDFLERKNGTILEKTMSMLKDKNLQTTSKVK
jgi:hypothetical protein